jgi:hypothetical protein
MSAFGERVAWVEGNKIFRMNNGNIQEIVFEEKR